MTHFLQRLIIAWKAYFNPKLINSTLNIDNDDRVSCFVFGKGKITRPNPPKGSSRIEDIVIRPKAFDENKNTKNLSVSKITDLLENNDQRSIWFIAKLVEKERQLKGKCNLYGRADLKVADIYDLGLKVVPQEPPPRHANMENFPIIKDKEENPQSLHIKNKLAQLAKGYLSKEVTPDINDILNENVSVKTEFEEHLKWVNSQ